MRESKGQNGNNISISAALYQSLQTINQFLDSFPADELEEQFWELTMYAFSSEDADSWSHLERSNMLYLYRQLSKLGKALTVIDKELRPVFQMNED
jgi:hypothetical protein